MCVCVCVCVHVCVSISITSDTCSIDIDECENWLILRSFESVDIYSVHVVMCSTAL